MWDFSLSLGLSMMMRSLPFLILRMLVYFGIAIGYVLVTGTGAGIGYGIGGFGDADFRASTTIWGGVIGFGLFAALLYVLREYILYIVKAGHIAVMVEMIEGRPLPQGRAQIDHAVASVKRQFGTANLLFVLDQLIKGVIAAITGLIRGVFTLLPIPGAQQLTSVLQAFLRVAVGFIDEVILAHILRHPQEEPAKAARDGLVLYGQNYKAMLRNAAWLALFVYLLSFIVFLIMLTPAATLAYLIPGAWSAGGILFALIFAWSVKAALLEPLAIACLLQVFVKITAGQSPDPAWDARLEALSDKFKRLKNNVFSRPSPAQSGEAPPHL